MNEIETLMKHATATNKATVLAMIIDVKGSAYRKEGAWMVFTEGNPPMGAISGGCLENDLHKRAERLFNTGKTELVSYDMSSEDDLGWGRGAGCNGIVYVLLRDITQSFQAELTHVLQSLQNKEPVLFIQSIDDFTHYTFTDKKTDFYGFWDKDSQYDWIHALPFQNIAKKQKFGMHQYFVQLIWPAPDLYIIGAGLDAKPLVKFAHEVGFDVHVRDWRKEFCKKKYFPEAQSIRHYPLTDPLQDIAVSPLDFIVVLTHDFQQDVKLLQILKEQQVLYLGVLGSQKRTERLLGNQIPPNIHSPVGLPIGADGPEEIALSVVAELIMIKRGRKI